MPTIDQASYNKSQPDLEFVGCNLCGSNDYRIIYRALEDRDGLSKSFSASSDVFATEQIVRCRTCGLVYVNPRTPAALIAKSYAEADNDDYLIGKEGRLSTGRRGIKMIESYAPTKGRILDVGCAAGFFLKAAEERGWETRGIELSHKLVAYGTSQLGLDLTPGTLEDTSFPDAFFDAVTFWDVLEHVPNPRSTLKACRRILKPGGIILINYPDFNSLWAKLFRRKWWFLLSSHLYYFAPATLTALLNSEGFAVVSKRRHWQQLGLGYLASRLGSYSRPMAGLLKGLVESAGLEDKNITYYGSQTNIIARKIENPGDV